MAFPNDQQRAVIKHQGRPLVVVAGPGTGKTRTLVERMIRLLGEDSSRKVSFITFTRASRRDAAKRIEDTIGATVTGQADLEFPATSTLHAYAKALVHQLASSVGRTADFSVLIEDKGEKELLMKDVVSDLSLDVDIALLMRTLSCFRCTNTLPDDSPVEPYKWKDIVERFETLLVFYNTFDMEGLVSYACRILKTCAERLPPLYLQVDEYQDLNPTEQLFVQLAASHPNSQVVVVGDDAQSIYSFRYANYLGVRNLWESNEWEKIRFQECHRFTGAHVLNAAIALISDQGYLGGNLIPCPDTGQRILTLQCTKPELQTRAVANLISQIKSTKTNHKGESLNYKDFLVLCPTTTFVDIVVGELQDRFEIPAKQHRKAYIPQDHWMLLLVLRMWNSKDSLALRQWLAYSGFSESEITTLRLEAMNKGESLYTYCNNLPDSRIKSIYRALDQLTVNKGDFDKFRRALREFPNLLIGEDLFPEVGLTIDEVTRKPRSVGLVIRFIYEKFGLLESESEVGDEDKVLVTTLHSAKGLEAEFVFVTWMNSKYMPMAGRDVGEQRRLLYVALTRAKQDAILTFYENYDPVGKRLLRKEALSPFLREIENHIELRQVRASDL